MPKLYEDGSKPVKKSEAKEASLWNERVNIAKKAQDQWSEDSGAKRFVKEYNGDYGIVFQARNRKVPIPPINEVFAYVQADIATTYNRDPYITVNAKAGTPQGAALWEVILNYWWRELKTKEELEYEIVDKDLVGMGWHKVGYVLSENKEMMEQTDSNQKLYSEWVNWKDVVWNVGAKRPPKDCQWMAQRLVRPLSEVKKMYPAAKGLAGVQDPAINEDTFKKLTYKDDIKVAVLWEIWDKENKKIHMLAEGLEDRFLTESKPWPDYLSEFPFLMYWDFLVPGNARPMSAIAPWEAQILEEMILMGQAINHSKRWNRQAFIKNGQIDDNTLDKFERGDDGAILVYNGDSADIRFADFGQLPTDFYLLMDRLQAIKRNINGQPEFVRGGVTKTGTRTIGELNLMQEGNRGRQERKIDRLETHCENIARHMMAHLKANFDMEQTIRITGQVPEEIVTALGQNFNPQTGEVTFTPSEIEGEYDVDIKSGSTLPMDKVSRMQVMELILTTVAAAAAQGPISNFMNTLIQELLKNYDIKSLQQAYEMDLQQAAQEAEQESNQENIDSAKTQAEAQKRVAQARQITLDSEITGQEAAIGPMGRAQLERVKKEPLTPRFNGSVR